MNKYKVKFCVNIALAIFVNSCDNSDKQLSLEDKCENELSGKAPGGRGKSGARDVRKCEEDNTTCSSIS